MKNGCNFHALQVKSNYKIFSEKLESKKDEATGRMMMVPVEGSEFALEAELVLIAAGFLGCQSYVSDAFGVELTPRTNVKTAPDCYETSEPPWTIACCMGDPRGQRSSEGSRRKLDGIYESRVKCMRLITIYVIMTTI